MKHLLRIILVNLGAGQILLWATNATLAAEPGSKNIASPDTKVTIAQVAEAEPSNTAESSTAESREKGETIMREVADFYSKLKAFSQEISIDTIVKLNSRQTPELDINAQFEVQLKRPNHLSITQTKGTPALDLHNDSKVLAIYSKGSKQYLLLPAEQNAEKALHQPSFRTGYGCLKDSSLEAMLSNQAEPWTSFSPVPKNDEVSLLGEDTLDGSPVYKLRILGPKFTETIYVDRGKEPWIRKIVTFDTNVADIQMRGNSPRMISLSSTSQFKSMLSNPNLADRNFKFTAPTDATESRTLHFDEPIDPLLGKDSIDFSAELADGKRMTLSQFKKKKTVILDFWATWCGPCRAALPLVLQVATDYKKKGVVLFAVDEQEDKAKVDQFLKASNLPLTVVLDRDGSIGGYYGASAIPRTIVIDRKGVIRVVHTGFTPEIGSELSFELDRILGIKKKH